jgi:transposase
MSERNLLGFGCANQTSTHAHHQPSPKAAPSGTGLSPLDHRRRSTRPRDPQGQPVRGLPPLRHGLRVWGYYQRIMKFYRIRGQKKAEHAFIAITDDLAHETLPELKTFRRTLMQWRVEILNYFKNRVTNARCEGYNNKAKVIKKRAYGFKSFPNYRLRILTTCTQMRF